jgi:RNA polymerase sigma factor (sigma-70 family)
MRAPRVDEASLVAAAQAGDRRALDELVAHSLPFVYNIVGRALNGPPDVDDVVQDTMLRALHELPALRKPESFRAWLASIAVRQVGTHRQRRRAMAARSVALDEAVGVPDVGASFEDLTILRLSLSGQRRHAVLAGRWLDPDDRTLLSLWRLETADQLSRRDLASALGITVAHAGVRIQRMLEQLESSRMLVAALGARPRCAALGHVIADWDGPPSPLWRKRITRHVRSCAQCAGAGSGMVPAARLLVGLAQVPVPIALAPALIIKATLPATAAAVLATSVGSGPLAAGVAGTGGAAVNAGLLGHLVRAVGAHPVATLLTTVAVVTGTALTAGRSPPESGPPAAASPRLVSTAPVVQPDPDPLRSGHRDDRARTGVARVGQRGRKVCQLRRRLRQARSRRR